VFPVPRIMMNFALITCRLRGPNLAGIDVRLPAASGGRTYTVQPRGTLSKAVGQHYGAASEYMKIFTPTATNSQVRTRSSPVRSL
jgi:hypothetical protein